MRKRSGFVVGLVIAATAATIGVSVAGAGRLALRHSAGAASGWRTHHDPMGFTVEVPDGWSVWPDPTSGRVELVGGAGERIVAWPLFTGSQLDGSSAGLLLSRLASQLWPDARWSSPDAVSPGTVRMLGAAGERRATCVLEWTATPRGSAALLSMSSAPRRQMNETQLRAARILESFSIAGHRAPTANVALGRLSG